MRTSMRVLIAAPLILAITRMLMPSFRRALTRLRSVSRSIEVLPRHDESDYTLGRTDRDTNRDTQTRASNRNIRKVPRKLA